MFLKNNIYSNFIHGITLWNSNNENIHNCTIEKQNTGKGIYIIKSKNIIMDKCKILYNSVGVKIETGSQTNLIKNSDILNNNNGIVLTNSENNTIERCIITNRG